MTGFPKPPASVTPQSIATCSLLTGSAACRLTLAVTVPAVNTWVNGLAIYNPLDLPWEYTVQRVWWVNGSTITSTSVDMGIYTADGRRLYSTTPTAMVGASSAQYVTLGTPLTLSAGRYYLAWTCNNTTSRAFVNQITAAINGRLSGLLSQSSVATLPATATFATMTTTLVPYCGITRLAA